MGTEPHFPLRWEQTKQRVLFAFGCMKNGSPLGPDSINYRLIKSVYDIRLERELVAEVVDH